MEDKLNDARTKNKALKRKIGKIDAEILRCQLNINQLAPSVPCVQAPKQKKNIGTNTDSRPRKVSDASTQMPVLYIARRTGKVWYLSEHPNHVERKQQTSKRNIE